MTDILTDTMIKSATKWFTDATYAEPLSNEAVAAAEYSMRIAILSILPDIERAVREEIVYEAIDIVVNEPEITTSELIARIAPRSLPTSTQENSK